MNWLKQWFLKTVVVKLAFWPSIELYFEKRKSLEARLTATPEVVEKARKLVARARALKRTLADREQARADAEALEITRAGAMSIHSALVRAREKRKSVDLRRDVYANSACRGDANGVALQRDIFGDPALRRAVEIGMRQRAEIGHP